MRATDFCNFFDFSIHREQGKDEDDLNYNYIATDNQCCLRNRYIFDIKELADCFDSLLQDYVKSYIEEVGFKYNRDIQETYYEQALKWIETSELKEDTCHEVIKALVYPELIKDDVESIKTA